MRQAEPPHERLNLRDPTLIDVLLMAIVVGVLATLLGGYTYATGDQVEQLPMIMRAIDHSSLANDLFASADSPVRAYYASLIAFLTAVAPLSTVLVSLSLLTNALIAAITALCARDFYGGSNWAALLAIAIVMSATTFKLGSGNRVYITLLTPNGLAMPLGFLALWAGLRGYPVLCAVAAGLASLMHPTFGMETGALALVTLVLAELYCLLRRQAGHQRLHPGRLFAAALVLLGFAALWARRYLSMDHLGSDQLLDIYVHFRSPHHLAPSTFDRLEWLEAIGFLVATGIGWFWWQSKTTASRRLVASVPILITIILLLCLGGYIFVEVVPSAIWVAAQPYRLPFLLKWLGLMMAGGTVATFLRKSRDVEDRFDAYLLLAGVLSPLTMGLTHACKLLRRGAQEHFPLVGTFLSFGSTLIITVAILTVVHPVYRQTLLFLAFVSIYLVLVSPADRWVSRLLVVVMTSLLLVIVLVGNGFLPSDLNTALDKIRPEISLDDLTGDEVAVARYAREDSPEDAVFLAPPRFGQFRVTAERALLVDFKLFPGHLADEWQKRLFDSYGVPRGRGFDAAREMDRMYRDIDDTRLRALRSKYGVDYAVLYRETDTTLPIVYENKTYRVVRLSDALFR